MLNLSTSAVGSIKVALQDIGHKEMKGYGIKDAEPIFGDAIEREVKWKGNPDLSELAAAPCEFDSCSTKRTFSLFNLSEMLLPQRR